MSFFWHTLYIAQIVTFVLQLLRLWGNMVCTAVWLKQRCKKRVEKRIIFNFKCKYCEDAGITVNMVHSLDNILHLDVHFSS